MPVPEGHIGVREAAEALGCSAATVRGKYRSGELGGKSGSQPKRPRIYICVDDHGRPLDPDGRPAGGKSLRARVDALELRLDAVETAIGNQRGGAAEAERLRDAALLLQGIIEGQQRAGDLQADSARELADVLKEQGKVISTLLVGDLSGIAVSGSREPVKPA